MEVVVNSSTDLVADMPFRWYNSSPSRPSLIVPSRRPTLTRYTPHTDVAAVDSGKFYHPCLSPSLRHFSNSIDAQQFTYIYETLLQVTGTP